MMSATITDESQLDADVTPESRRQFLKLLGLGGAGLSIGMLASKPTAAATTIAPDYVKTDQTQAVSVVLDSLTAEPASLDPGELFYRSDLDEIRYSPDGSTTKQVGGSDVDLSPIRRNINDNVVALARLQFEHSLSELGYDGGSYDIFRDESKIASKTDVDVSTLDGGDSVGKIELAVSGNSSTNSTGSGPYDTVVGSISTTLTINEDKTYVSKVGVEGASNTAAYVDIIIKDSGGNTLASASVSTTWGSPVVHNFSESDFSRRLKSGEDITISLNTTNAEDIIQVDSSSDSKTLYSFTGQEKAGDSGTTFTAIEVAEVVFMSTGAFTSTQKDLANDGFSNPPVNLTLSQDADIPANHDLQYIITSGNGETVTVTQNEVDSEVDCSNFTSTAYTVKGEYSGDGTDTPELRSYAVHGKEGS